MADPTEENLTFETRSGEIAAGDLHPVRASGRQALDTLYEYRIELSSQVDGGLSPDAVQDMLRYPCRLELSPSAGQPAAEIHGILSEIELRSMTSPDEALYEAVLRPRLWKTTLPFNSRVFQDKDVSQILAAVLGDSGVPHELRLDATYPVRSYVVQYAETDFAFLSRLMEHWGIFYFFEQGPDGEVMILGDSKNAFAPLDEFETIPFAAEATSRVEDGGHVLSLSRRYKVRPEKVRLEDYNWRTPQVKPEGEAEADTATGFGTQRYYGEHIKDPSEGAMLAQVRAEQLQVEREVYHGTSTLRALAPGHRFELSGYPVGDLDQEYVVTSVEHTSGVESGGFRQGFTAIPYSVPHRPQRVAPRPKINGFMHAVVDGTTPGMAAPIDEQGRYKVVMPYDAYGEPGNANASRWVRMSQTSSGPDYGFHFPLHIGIEVAIAHLDGDPDRPVIVGATPNPDTSSPVTSADSTKSRIKTKSGILIEFEDAG